ncbi:MAG: sugar phosphate isomerase/epimerase [Cyclobacteriaceae bacterium]|nr:sugar phosphate isomerase/epimerase [Cyclobacteriaceae bacterium]
MPNNTKTTHSRRKALTYLAALPFFPADLTGSEIHKREMSVQHPERKPPLSLNLYSFNQPLQEGTMKLQDICRYCAEEGYAAIDPTAYYFPGYPEVPDDTFLFEFKRMVFELGLEISGSGIRNNFSDPDRMKRQQDIRLIENWLAASQKMGIPVLRIFAGSEIPNPQDKKKALGWMMDDFKQCADLGARYGVIIALQNHNEFIKTADEVIGIIETVNSPWFKLHLDIGSFTVKNVYEEIQKVIPYAVNWQVKELVTIDGEKVEPDFERIIRMVKDQGYVGYFPLETLGPGDPKKKLVVLKQKVITAMDRVFI